MKNYFKLLQDPFGEADKRVNGGKKKMKSLKEEAEEYESRATKVISDLEKFDINMNVFTFKGVDSDGEHFSYKYVEDKEGVKYRIPWSVLEQVKAYLEEEGEQELFKVKKRGEGLNTRYTVIPVQDGGKK